MVRPFVDHPGGRPPGAGTLPTLAAALTALGTYRARLTETGLVREFVEAGRLRSEGVDPRHYAAAVEPADMIELTRLATDVRVNGRGEVQYRIRGAAGRALRARARGVRPRRHRRRRDRGRRQRARAPLAGGDDRAPADRARGASLHGVVRQRGHLPRDLPEPERRTRSWAASRRTRTPRTGWPRCTPTTGMPTRRSWPRRCREREREHRVPPVRGRRRDALAAGALEEPGAARRLDRGHRHRHGHLLEPGRRGCARRQRGQAGARPQGRRRLRLRVEQDGDGVWHTVSGSPNRERFTGGVSGGPARAASGSA